MRGNPESNLAYLTELIANGVMKQKSVREKARNKREIPWDWIADRSRPVYQATSPLASS